MSDSPLLLVLVTFFLFSKGEHCLLHTSHRLYELATSLHSQQAEANASDLHVPSLSLNIDANIDQRSEHRDVDLLAHRVSMPCACPEYSANANLNKRRDAIVILTSKRPRKRIPQLGATDTLATDLDASLSLLYQNFNRCFRKDVLIFHNGDFSKEDQEITRNRYGLEIQFHLLKQNGTYWQLYPKWLEGTEESWIDWPDYDIGYRNMIRWNGLLLYDYLAGLGYEWYMRLDDDSMLLSCINYDIFRYMENRGKVYGYRLAARDSPLLVKGVVDLAKEFLADRKLVPSSELLSHMEGNTLSSQAWDRLGYYNNFHISRLSFWQSPDARAWLKKVDESGTIFTHRVGDMVIQTLALLMLAPWGEIHRFSDWAYGHVTIRDNVGIGGIFAGDSQEPAEVIDLLRWLNHSRDLPRKGRHEVVALPHGESGIWYTDIFTPSGGNLSAYEPGF